jgi:hypothetical protein
VAKRRCRNSTVLTKAEKAWNGVPFVPRNPIFIVF